MASSTCARARAVDGGDARQRPRRREVGLPVGEAQARVAALAPAGGHDAQVAGAARRADAREQLVAAAVQALHEQREHAADRDADDRQRRAPQVAADAARGVPACDIQAMLTPSARAPAAAARRAAAGQADARAT